MQGLLAAFTYDPIVHISLGPLNISPHGVGIAVGFLLGARLMLPEAERNGIGEDAVYTILIRAAIGALLGARIAYVANHFADYTDDLLGIFKVWQGGISLLGGIFGAIVLALPVARKLGVDAWRLLDSAAPGIALGILIGRTGDLIVADHLGKPAAADFVLGYKCVPRYATASPCIADVVHQPHLYDLFFVTILLFLLLLLRRSTRPRYDGFEILVFGACYGVARFIEDFFRIDETHGTGLTGSQWSSVATTLLCTSWLVAVKRKPGWGHWNDTDGSPPRVAVEQPDMEER
ncbi:MAG TPA: prolipoprotein diacylglyceryl transferase family protein [Acidimicrobiales bacterium]|nr:prolipoprotein diacylglyceryl transferase family protein [Acidimicrobiales bacterium]